MKKLLPYLLLGVLLVVALVLRRYQSSRDQDIAPRATKQNKANEAMRSNLDYFRDVDSEYYFTKHARCRMTCRSITQKEVKEIVRKADVNYNKSDLDATQGPKYALEGYTSKDRQHLRIIVAPKQRHLSIVTVIDLDKDGECPSCD